ncbi:hypothetical protein M0D69_09510, partial [Caballeronia sp. SEWSISQ10-4 2]|uniref:hypothetical protein n=1 Tax=Caballeronia sp. SEWSISQ10-4 2 TaxID=2937438 RepID=UPI00265597CC
MAALVVWVDAERGGFGVSGQSGCRGGAFGLSGLRELADFFVTISHCAWWHVISFSNNGENETKQRKRFPTKGELVSLA